MAETTFSIAVSSDDGEVIGSSASYPPASASGTDDSTADLDVIRWLSGGTYEIRTGHLRFDTSSIPDSDIISAARIDFYCKAKQDANDRNLVAEHFDWGTIAGTSDWTSTAPSSPIGSLDIGTITTSAVNSLHLTSFGGINKTGITHFRLHISGGQPTGLNWVQMASFDDTVNVEPRLVVTHAPAGGATEYVDSATVYFDIQPAFAGSAGMGSKIPARMPESSGSTIIYVDAGAAGLDAPGRGAIGSPYKTLDYVKNNVLPAGLGNAAGWIIKLRGGTNFANKSWYLFDPNNMGGTSANPLTIEAVQDAGGIQRGARKYEDVNLLLNTVETDADWDNIALLHCQGIRFRGLRFTAIDAANQGGGGLTIRNSRYIEVEDCIFDHTKGHGIGIFAHNDHSLTFQWSQWIWIVNCEWKDIGGARTSLAGATPAAAFPNEGYWRRGTHPIYIGGVHAVEEWDHRARDVYVINPIIHDSKWGRGTELGAAAERVYILNATYVRHGKAGSNLTATELTDWQAGCAMLFFENTRTYQTYIDCHYINCIAYDCGGHAGDGTMNYPGDNSNKGFIENSIAYNCRFYAPDNSQFRWTYGTGRLYSKTNVLEVDPMFVNPTHSDPAVGLELQPNSPGRAIGFPNLDWVPLYDHRGRTRSTTRPSIGAVEVPAVGGSYTDSGTLSFDIQISGTDLHTLAGTATFGVITPGALAAGRADDALFIGRHNLVQSGVVSKLRAYGFGDNSLPAQSIKGVIYRDDPINGRPGTLVAVTTATTLDNEALGWHDLNFASPIALTAGDYWLGVLFGPQNNGFKLRNFEEAGHISYSVFPVEYDNPPNTLTGGSPILGEGPSVQGIYTPGGAEITDAASIPFDIQISGVDVAQRIYTDSATINYDLDFSGIETFLVPNTEFGTISFDIQFIGDEFQVFQFVDATTVYYDIAFGGTELYTPAAPPVQKVDAATIYLSIQPITRVELHNDAQLWATLNVKEFPG